MGHDDSHVLELDGVSMQFRQRGGTVRAVEDVSLGVRRSEVMGLVGESGSGKSTLARCAVRLLEPTSGRIRLLGQDVTHLGRNRLRPVRRRVHMVFQDAASAMNPRMTVRAIVAEPLRQQGIRGRERQDRAMEMLERVGLTAAHGERFVHQLSGGQRQRVGIARSLVMAPDLLVADEAVSALDVSIQASILNLLVRLQRDLGFSCLFITHDLSVVEYLADRIAVMYLGRIVEVGPSRKVFERPEHPYTQALLSAAPGRDREERETIVLRGDIPSPISPPPGCHFSTRCPVAMENCHVDVPDLLPVGSGHDARCLRIDDPGGVPRLVPQAHSGNRS